jgi:hypothetical protein
MRATVDTFGHANTQNRASHIHTVWRDFDGDFAATCCVSITATHRTRTA